ncbi:helix-turn-helix domain-containing protein [Actinokineospora sp. PR83]|uniref:PucR family transcriptional regulator n=1 Tax=Actinokineospora sp. PR83 TaxID=2884908 RepID=UPI001F39281F|nr:helix-turn-helix domain-containing protein [Actinokineospora sp. PR83]MCG8920647.1 helix-turn-helix domain-containing protein [Actinokineospora sp. PR83]
MTAAHVDERHAVLRREVVEALRREEAADGLPQALLDPLVETIRTAVTGCLQVMEHPDDYDTDEWAALFRARRGALPEGLHRERAARAYRVGARIAWEIAVVHARRVGVPPDRVARGAEVVFAYLGAMADSGLPPVSRALARVRLVGLLLQNPPPGRPQLAEVAAEAEWPLPGTVRVVALRHRPGGDPRLFADLGPDVLLDIEGPEPCVIAPASGLDPTAVANALPGWRAALGPATPVSTIHSALEVANRALDLVEKGRIPDAPVVDCDEHLLSLALFTDDFLIDTLADRQLAPLEPLRNYQRVRLLATLDQWFATRGRVVDMAEHLGVHQQTIRYRVNRLTELFGDQLADPRKRFDLELAVRAKVRHQRAS